ncbi:tRNA (adenosine(37)-N6)-threonylcarbamoyltransferase complex dimerization subunit type 1 TsaB [Acidiferrobacter sp.]|uniref:tRNA (adenosine(37)-N6)-threonylcarbamoyltransferase complex dimerization subunit type 1 TsaB n=1 Tax=Acidiferrobacter sp. TaxID=1872107 RepID=UPI00261D34D0|nr:tRNA (adenosine(37)-N6)-threonylcarbamoyltransferase complex dimerization subunit type 1 TsaB [Acidiferrobacter sp.]
MNLLAIETATAFASVALKRDGVIHERGLRDVAARAETVLDLVRGLCEDLECDLCAIDAIAFGRGPGSFTGLRVAAAVTQGLAYARNLPVVPISSLAALAQEAPGREVLATLDARRDEVYYGFYRRTAAGLVVACGDERVAPPGEVAWRAGTDCVVGCGIDHYEQKFEEAFARYHIPGCIPTARGVLMLAEEAYGRGQCVSPQAAVPVYIRDDVAQARA